LRSSSYPLYWWRPRLKNYAARGFAARLASHGIGAARAFQVNPMAGTFAGIALGLNGSSLWSDAIS